MADNKKAVKVPKPILPVNTTEARNARKIKRSVWEGEEVVDYHKPFSAEDFESFIDFCHSDDPQWVQCLKKENLIVWKRELTKEEKSNSDIRCIRLQATFEGYDPDKLYDLMHDHEYRRTWDENMLDGYPVQIINKTHEVGYYAAKTPPGMNQRDFCNKRGWRRMPERKMWMIMNESVRHPGCPEYKEFIRAWSYRTGTLLKDIGDGKVQMIYTTRSDPRGWIPAWLVNSIATKFVPKFLDKVFKAYAKYDVWVNAQESQDKFWLDDEEDDPTIGWTPKQARKNGFRKDKVYTWPGAKKVKSSSSDSKKSSAKEETEKSPRKSKKAAK